MTDESGHPTAVPAERLDSWVAPAAESTGDGRVDSALARLADLPSLPLAAQVTVFDDVNRLLQDALTPGDDGQQGTPDP